MNYIVEPCTYLGSGHKLCTRDRLPGRLCCLKHQRKNDRVIEKLAPVSLKKKILSDYRTEISVEELPAFEKGRLAVVPAKKFLAREFYEPKTSSKIRFNSSGIKSLFDDQPEFLWERFQNGHGFDFPGKKMRKRFVEFLGTLGEPGDLESEFYCRKCDRVETVRNKKECELHPDSNWFQIYTCSVKIGIWDVLARCIRFGGSENCLIVFSQEMSQTLERRMIAEWVIHSRPAQN